MGSLRFVEKKNMITKEIEMFVLDPLFHEFTGPVVVAFIVLLYAGVGFLLVKSMIKLT